MCSDYDGKLNCSRHIHVYQKLLYIGRDTDTLQFNVIVMFYSYACSD